MSNFPLMYPHCAALKLRVIDAGPGFDELDVEQALGLKRFAALMKSVSRVFVCNHAKYSATFPQPTGEALKSHRVRGYEVHCVYAEDLEKFLAAEGK